MKYLLRLFFFAIAFINLTASNAQSFNKNGTDANDKNEKARWEKYVAQTTIIRDEWGIPHI